MTTRIDTHNTRDITRALADGAAQPAALRVPPPVPEAPGCLPALLPDQHCYRGPGRRGKPAAAGTGGRRAERLARRTAGVIRSGRPDPGAARSW
jgi:hypothetical protein